MNTFEQMKKTAEKNLRDQQEAARKDRISLPATLTGLHGRAWLLDKQAVSFWLVEAPWAHPFWHSYVISLIHLRKEEGLDDPIIHFPDASHEMCLWAMDPAHGRERLILHNELRVLQPMNFAAQWVAKNDADAAEKIMGHVQEILRGDLSPDTDFKGDWIRRFNMSMCR